MSEKAPVLWAQRNGELFLKVDLQDIKNPVFDLNEEANLLKFSGKSNGKPVEVEIEFYAPIKKEGSVYVVHGKATEMVIQKKESGPHWPRLLKGKEKVTWLRVDWSKFVDDDDEDKKKGGEGFDMSGFDPSSMGSFGGASGAGGMDFSSLAGAGRDEDGDEDEGPPGLS